MIQASSEHLVVAFPLSDGPGTALLPAAVTALLSQYHSGLKHHLPLLAERGAPASDEIRPDPITEHRDSSVIVKHLHGLSWFQAHVRMELALWSR